MLVQLDFDSLKEIGVRSAGHRLELLKAIYRLKVDNGVAIEPEHYVPNCEPLSDAKCHLSLEVNDQMPWAAAEAIEDVFSDNTPLGRLMQLISNQSTPFLHHLGTKCPYWTRQLNLVSAFQMTESSILSKRYSDFRLESCS